MSDLLGVIGAGSDYRATVAEPLAVKFSFPGADGPCRCDKHAEPCAGFSVIPVLMTADDGTHRLVAYCCHECNDVCRADENARIRQWQDEDERASIQQALDERYDRAHDVLLDTIVSEFRDVTSDHPVIADRVAKMRAYKEQERQWLLARAARAANRSLPRPAEPTLRPQGLFVVGPVGRGKTHLAYSLLHALLAERLVEPSRVLVGTENDLFAAPARGRYSEYNDSVMRRIDSGEFDVLLIDDLGRGTWAGADEHRARVLGNVFEAAMTHRRLVIATCNALITTEKNEVKTLLTDAAYSRLKRLVTDDEGKGLVYFREEDHKWRD